MFSAPERPAASRESWQTHAASISGERIRPIPRVGDDVFQGVRRIREQVVAAGLRPVLHLADLLADRDQRVAETIQLFLRLALGGLDHQGAGDRERDRRWMEAVIDDALRDILHLDAGGGLEGPAIDDALVRDQAVLPG